MQALTSIDAKFGLTAGDSSSCSTIYSAPPALERGRRRGISVCRSGRAATAEILDFERYPIADVAARASIECSSSRSYKASFHLQKRSFSCSMTSTISSPTPPLSAQSQARKRLKGSTRTQIEFVGNVVAPPRREYNVYRHRDPRPDATRFSTTDPLGTCRPRMPSSPCSNGTVIQFGSRGTYIFDEAAFFQWLRRAGRAPPPHRRRVLDPALLGSWSNEHYDHRGLASADGRNGAANGFHILSVDGLCAATRGGPAKEAERTPVTASSIKAQPLPRNQQGRRQPFHFQ